MSWAAAAVAPFLLALGFLGLAHALLETIAGKAHRRDPAHAPGLRGSRRSPAVSVALLVGLTVAALWLPGKAASSRHSLGAIT